MKTKNKRETQFRTQKKQIKQNLPSKVQDKIQPAKEQRNGAYFISDSSFAITRG